MHVQIRFNQGHLDRSTQKLEHQHSSVSATWLEPNPLKDIHLFTLDIEPTTAEQLWARTVRPQKPEHTCTLPSQQTMTSGTLRITAIIFYSFSDPFKAGHHKHCIQNMAKRWGHLSRSARLSSWLFWTVASSTAISPLSSSVCFSSSPTLRWLLCHSLFNVATFSFRAVTCTLSLASASSPRFTCSSLAFFSANC